MSLASSQQQACCLQQRGRPKACIACEMAAFLTVTASWVVVRGHLWPVATVVALKAGASCTIICLKLDIHLPSSEAIIVACFIQSLDGDLCQQYPSICSIQEFFSGSLALASHVVLTSPRVSMVHMHNCSYCKARKRWQHT